MKAVILAAGKGIRMKPLTNETPKPLLKVNGKVLIDHVLEALPYEIKEIIIVVKYLGDQVKDHVGDENRWRTITYVEGSDKGNSYSFLAAGEHLKDERFLLIYGDEIPNRTNINNCLREHLSVLTYDDGTYDGVMVLNTDMFDYKPTDDQFKTSLQRFVDEHDVKLVEAERFVGGINTPNDIDRVEKELKKTV